MDIDGSWRFVRGSPLIDDKYFFTYDASYLCLDLWIWLLWLLFVLPTYVFECMDVFNLLDELDPSWGSFEMQEGWLELEKVKRHYMKKKNGKVTQEVYV